MPPCADNQHRVVPDVLYVLRVGGETRGADAAVWREADWPATRGTFVSVPPVLAVEVEGGMRANRSQNGVIC